MKYADHLPESVTLGATTYKIMPRTQVWGDAEGVAGQVRWPNMEIDIVAEGKPSEIANTLIHECLHVCYREWHIKPKCGEERTVTALGFALTALYAQNPDLLESISNLLLEE